MKDGKNGRVLDKRGGPFMTPSPLLLFYCLAFYYFAIALLEGVYNRQMLSKRHILYGLRGVKNFTC